MPMDRKRVIVAGHICLDITPSFPISMNAQVEDLLQPGKLVEVGEAVIHTGGVVSNTGLAMKIFGADVMLLGKIGDDSLGKLVMEHLGEHVDTSSMVVAEKASTSYSIVLAVPGYDRMFLHHPGANNLFTSEDITDEVLQQGALFHFGYPPLMKSMYEDNGRELVDLFRRAKQYGLITSLDMAAVDPASEAANADWKSILQGVLPYVDIFVPSAEEICYMIDRDRYEEWMRRAGDGDPVDHLTMEDIKSLGDKLIQFGARIALIKCGHLGMYYRAASSDAVKDLPLAANKHDEWTMVEHFEASYIPDRVLSATGAGDTSVAAFLMAMLEGYTLQECLQLATAAGAACVSEYDALSGLMPLNELRSKILQGWKKRDLTHITNRS